MEASLQRTVLTFTTTVGYHCLKLSQNRDTNTLNNLNVLSMDCCASEGDTYLPVSWLGGATQ